MGKVGSKEGRLAPLHRAKTQTSPRTKRGGGAQSQQPTPSLHHANSLMDGSAPAIPESVQSAQLDISDLEFDSKPIGRGGSGYVVKGRWKKTGKEIAIKVLNFEEELLNEIKIGTLVHVNLVKYFGWFQSETGFGVVMEFFPLGDLNKLLRNESLEFNLQQILKIAYDIANGLYYLHTQHVIHRDLKPANILVASIEPDNITVKLTDFGLARTMDFTMTTKIGSPLYMAPEMFCTSHYTEAVDIYSFGILLAEIVTRKDPYNEYKEKFLDPLVNQIREGRRPSTSVSHLKIVIPAEMFVLMELCWQVESNARPTALQVLNTLDSIKKDLPSTSSTPSLPSPSSFNSGSGTGSGIGKPRSYTQIALGSNSVTMSASASDDAGMAEAKEDQISRLFNGGDSLPWSEFKKNVMSVLKADDFVIDKLEFIFADENGQVSTSKWRKLQEYFYPILPTQRKTMYQGNADDSAGYSLETIAAQLGQLWFHGFLSGNAAQDLLTNQPSKTFLIRFSATTRGAYAITLKNSDTSVYHWCVEATEDGGFMIPPSKVRYTSLTDILSRHQNTGLLMGNHKDISAPLSIAYPRSSSRVLHS